MTTSSARAPAGRPDDEDEGHRLTALEGLAACPAGGGAYAVAKRHLGTTPAWSPPPR
jgi:hypothetical protein